MNKTLRLLKQLIFIPSFVNNTTDEFEMGNYIKNYFSSLNYKVETQLVEGKRKNIICGNTTNPEVVILGHMDTVLPKEQTIPSSRPIIIGNKFYGLGAVDMKAGLSIMLSLAGNIRYENIAYVFTCDEEYEFKGSFKLVESYSWKPKLIINLEPTGLQIGNGCRGITEFSFDIYGKAAHASRKYLGVNAIEKAVKMTQQLEKELQKFDKDIITSLNLSYLEGGVLQHMENNKPLVNKLGMVVPDFSRINCEIRIGNSKVTQPKIAALLKTLGKKEKVSVKNISFKFFLGMFFTPKEELKEFEAAIQTNNIPVIYRDINTAGFYEVQMLQKAWNCNAVIFGPGPIEKAHAANEYVEISSVYQTQSILEEYLKNMVS